MSSNGSVCQENILFARSLSSKLMSLDSELWANGGGGMMGKVSEGSFVDAAGSFPPPSAPVGVGGKASWRQEVDSRGISCNRWGESEASSEAKTSGEDKTAKVDEVGFSDSELFFDFDLDGPPSDEQKDRPETNGRHLVTAPERQTGYAASDQVTEISTAFSTAYGSDSSPSSSQGCARGEEGGESNGGGKDGGEVQPVLEGFSIDPSEWQNDFSAMARAATESNSLKATSCSTPEASLPCAKLGVENGPMETGSDIGKLEIRKESPAEKHDDRGEPYDDSDDEDFSEGVAFKVGDGEHRIAKDKLLKLMSFLNKDRDYGLPLKTERDPLPPKKTSSFLPSIFGDAAKLPLPPKWPLPLNSVSTTTSVAGSLPSSSLLASKPMDPFLRKESKNLKAPNEGGRLKRSESAPQLGDKFLHISIVIGAGEKEAAAPVVVADASSATLGEESCQLETDFVDGAMAAEEPPKKNEDEDTDTKSKYRRCSSLKSGKTPPGSPRRKKIVQFADLFGLDLTAVKTYMDEIPRVPKSAFKDLKDAELSDLDSDSGSDRGLFPTPGSPVLGRGRRLPTYRGTGNSSNDVRPKLVPLFSQPGGTPIMFNNLRDKKVSLDTAYPNEHEKLIKGVVRVVNMDFHKTVVVRYTLDDWSTFNDVNCNYMSGTADGFSDLFSFAIDCSTVIGQVGKRLQFCIKYVCLGNEFWDSNNGGNYIFQYFGGRKIPSANPPRRERGRLPIGSGARAIHLSSSGRSVYAPMSHSPSTMGDDPWGHFM